MFVPRQEHDVPSYVVGYACDLQLLGFSVKGLTFYCVSPASENPKFCNTETYRTTYEVEIMLLGRTTPFCLASKWWLEITMSVARQQHDLPWYVV